ncbi:MAG: hypothetical protein JWN40_351, partial [Phycisphaerales bacterium]|nr:hypothetical protein [Phycisphaerales bacterium]
MKHSALNHALLFALLIVAIPCTADPA